MLQAIREELRQVAALREAAACCESQRQSLTAKTVYALDRFADLFNQRQDLSCLQDVQASRTSKRQPERAQMNCNYGITEVKQVWS